MQLLGRVSLVGGGLISLDVISVASAVGDGYATRLPAYAFASSFQPAYS
jgi:hypothetical protein